MTYRVDSFTENNINPITNCEYDSTWLVFALSSNMDTPMIVGTNNGCAYTIKIYCGKCQCLMVGESGTSRTKFVHRYYKCVSVKNHKGCDKKTVKKAWIEDLVIDSVRKLIMNDETIEYLTDLALETFNQESTVLPILQKQYAQTLTAINNLITAMEQGIIIPTTKARMEELEAEKSELSIRIMKEEMSRPKLTREEILYWFYKFRKLNPKKLDHRRSLINNFVNSVFLYEDRMVITFNFKDSTETITFADLEKSALGSDLKVSGAPRRSKDRFAPLFFV